VQRTANALAARIFGVAGRGKSVGFGLDLERTLLSIFSFKKNN